MDSRNIPIVELAFWSKNAISSQVFNSGVAKSEGEERAGVTTPFSNIFNKIGTFHEQNPKDDTQGFSFDEVIELRLGLEHTFR